MQMLTFQGAFIYIREHYGVNMSRGDSKTPALNETVLDSADVYLRQGRCGTTTCILEADGLHKKT